MKRLSILFLIFLIAPTQADKPLGKPAVKHLKAKEAGELWKANKDNDGFIVLDVRTPAEHASVRIPNSKNIDVLASDFAAKAAKLDKERTYLLHCQSGQRSRTALKALQKLGFLKLCHLDGGILAWQKEGLQVEKAEQAE